MFQFKINQMLSTTVYAASILFTLVVLPSCGTTKYQFTNSSAVPAAEGSVKVKKDGNNNYKIDLDVMHLAQPERLSPPKAVYMVWMETEQYGNKNIGQLKTSSGFLSKTLKSSLKTVSSFKPINFFVSAENDSNIQYPGEVIFRTGAK